MASKNKPYEPFGSYILLKRLESDALGELFRAVRIEQDSLGSIVALRRLTGGNREALLEAAEKAQAIVPSLTGSSFAKDQQIEIIDDLAVITHDYASGRSLRYIVDRARGGAGVPPNPIPLDQAVVIAERVALSLATMADLRVRGERLVHGALIPQFIWITDDGEIRVAGQQMGRGLAASLRDEKVAGEIGRYFAPETHHSGDTTKATEVYTLGAILYLLITGQEPPDATRTSAFTHAVRAGKTMAGTPVPDDIRAILEKSLNIDPAGRFPGPADMRNALSALSASGKYSGTSFNLAFYLTSLLKKELEAEVAEREREAKISVEPYLHGDAAEASIDLMTALPDGGKKSKMPVAAAAALALIAVGAGAWFALAPKQSAPAKQAVKASAVPTPAPKPILMPEPIVASPSGTTSATTAGTSTTLDEAAKKKMFEEAVKKRLQEELLKLQTEHTRQLQREQARTAPVVSTAPPQTASAPSSTEERPSAAQFDQQRRDAGRADEPSLPVEPVAGSLAPAPSTTETTTQVAAQTTPPPAPAPPIIREGDVVDMTDLDRVPAPLREPRPVYPPMAARQKVEATVMASLLISETGEVLEVKILRGEPRFGFNESAVRAFRGARYSPAMKDGKRVKTWVAQMIQFKP